MKEAVLLSQLLILPARALEDDLFWRPDPLAPTVRNFVWQGKIHQSVRIQHYDGTNVTLATTEGTIIVPLSRLPSLWRSAILRRSWPGTPPFAATSESVSVSGSGPADREEVRSGPELVPQYTTMEEWRTARVAAVARVAGQWPADYRMQVRGD